MPDLQDQAIEPAAKPKGEAGPEARAPFTSVIYVHGIGSQRRYEETSRLVDRLDQYLQRQHARGNSLGMLSKIRPRVEPLRPNPASGIIAYIRTVFSTGPRFENARSVRFYEIYWAPIMAQTDSVRRVIQWVFRQPLRPWHTLPAPWRERQRLRRAALATLFDGGRKPPRGVEAWDFDGLIGLYNDFEGPEALRAYPAGTFKDFLAFVAKESEGHPETARRREALARAWRALYVREELRNAVVLTTMALALFLSAVGVVLGLVWALQGLARIPLLTSLLQTADVPLKVDWKTAATLAASLASLLGLGKLVTDYLGDVEAWATYEETDLKHVARQKVIDNALETLTHVLCDPDCERVVIVAHSLGTSIAHDALLALTRRNRAFSPKDAMSGPVPLGKIEHFVTLGSPIDKIEYFFESYASAFHRYKRVVESLRGDIGDAPFSDNRHPHIHWINYWDEGDIISGALQSPTAAAPKRQRIDNVHVASFRFPAPGASHAGYFDNARVIGDLFQMIFHRRASFKALEEAAGKGPYDYASAYLHPGEPTGSRTPYFVLILLIPWLVLFGAAAWMLEARTIAAWLGAGAGALAAGLFGAFLFSRARGQRSPI